MTADEFTGLRLRLNTIDAPLPIITRKPADPNHIFICLPGCIEQSITFFQAGSTPCCCFLVEHIEQHVHALIRFCFTELGFDDATQFISLNFRINDLKRSSFKGYVALYLSNSFQTSEIRLVCAWTIQDRDETDGNGINLPGKIDLLGKAKTGFSLYNRCYQDGIEGEFGADKREPPTALEI